MSATLKPELYASWVPTGKIVLKPEIYISGIPTGKIFVEPLIFATYISAPIQKKNSFDTVRKISKEESANGDTLRKVGQGENFSADTKRALSKTEKVQADTSRKIGITIARADLQRNVKSRIKNSFDTRIIIGEREKISADTKRAICWSEKFSGDTFLQIVASEKVIADLLRGLREIFRADTFRKVARKEKFSASTVIRIPHILKYVVRNKAGKLKKSLLKNSQTSLINTFKDYGVTAINISLNEKTLSDEFTFDITQPMEINETVQGYLLDYPFHFLVEEITEQDGIRSVKGRYSVDEQLYTWFKMPYGDDGDDDTSDYYPKASAAIEEIAGDLGLSADIKIDDFTPNNLRKGDMVTYADVLSSVFGWTSRLPQRQINIFIRDGVLHCIQRGKEEQVFDITDLDHSRPTINKKFNRVLCNNPNKSDEDDDDNKIKFTGSIGYKSEGVIPYQNRIYITLNYQGGLLTSEHISMMTKLFADNEGNILLQGQHSRTSYNYRTWAPKGSSKDDEQHYLSSKEIHSESREQNMTTHETERTITDESTYYGYEIAQSGDELYLFHEKSNVETTVISSGDEERELVTKDTYHFPVGNGFYSQIVYQNGILQGGNLSQGAPGNQVSPYTVDQIRKNFSSVEATDYDNFDDQLQAIVDDSFPVRETEFKTKLNEDLRWLHLKTVETVTVDLISKVVDGVPEINHIVDFTERIKLDGAEYFLVSNRISFTPRKLIQKLQMIRWY